MANIPPYDITPEELEQIEAYLTNRLGEEEQQLFVHRLGQDEQLRAKVAEVRNMMVGIEEAVLKSQLPAYHAAIDTAAAETLVRPLPSGGRSGNRRWWMTAAAVLLVLAATWVLWPRGSREERLFARYYMPDAGLPVAMGSADSASYVFYDGMVSYKEGDYAAALSKWNSLESTTAGKDTLHYYQAMAHLNLNDLPRAAALLSPLTAMSGFPLREDAIWYLALIELRSGNRAAAIDKLRQLTGRDEAQQLLSELED